VSALHPLIIHFAIALLLIGPAMDTLGLLLRREGLLIAGRWNVLVGAVMLLFAEATGFGAQAGLGPHSPAGEALLNLHAGLGYLCMAIWLPVAVWRGASKQLLPLRLRTLYLVLSFTGATLVLAQAGLGAALIYRHGVGLSPAARAEPMIHQPAAPAAIDHPRMTLPVKN